MVSAFTPSCWDEDEEEDMGQRAGWCARVGERVGVAGAWGGGGSCGGGGALLGGGSVLSSSTLLEAREALESGGESV